MTMENSTLADGRRADYCSRVHTMLLHEAQPLLCSAFERVGAQDSSLPSAVSPEGFTGPEARFGSMEWQRPGGGGGTARVLSEGAVFERAGVNVSAIAGEGIPAALASKRSIAQDQPFFATGISLVLHPRNPYVPAFHANFRYFDVGDDWWFGGGMDLTPCYGFVADATHFHQTLKACCDRHAVGDYHTFKQACDEYFYLTHRQEMRGIGGIFVDMLHPDGPDGWERAYAFMQDGIHTILAAYLPIVQGRMHMPYGERERQWQLYRRGRYVEFNLVYDRGTVFGLQANGNIEAILMSLPPLARWEFYYQPEAGSPEAELAAFLQPRDWVE